MSNRVKKDTVLDLREVLCYGPGIFEKKEYETPIYICTRALDSIQGILRQELNYQ